MPRERERERERELRWKEKVWKSQLNFPLSLYEVCPEFVIERSNITRYKKATITLRIYIKTVEIEAAAAAATQPMRPRDNCYLDPPYLLDGELF